MKDRIISCASIVFSIALSYSFCYWWASILRLSNPDFYAIGLSSCLMIHELGHFILFEASGVKSSILFCGFVVVNIGKYDAKGKSLLPEHRLSISIAGCVANLIAILAANIFQRFNLINYSEFSAIANINGLFIFGNLLPLYTSDGRRVLKWLFNSDKFRSIDPIPELRQKCWLFLFMAMLAVGLLTFFSTINFFSYCNGAV